MAVDFDYYQALGLSRNATDLEVKKAFRKLALIYHPDRNTSNTAKQDFFQICEAYDILSNPQCKGVLDLHGEQALKAGSGETDDPNAGWSAYKLDPVIGPEKVFSRFFGTSNPYEALNGLALHFEQMAGTPKLEMGKQNTHTLLLSLEEMYHGCTKKVSHDRTVVKDGVSTTEHREHVIHVQPGLPEGTQFVFHKEGDSGPKHKAGPVAYILKAQPHPRFTCRGFDLLYTAQIPLYQALCGTSVPVETLDGRVLHVPVTDIVRTGDKTTIAQEGLKKSVGQKGDLHITFEVIYPVALSEHQRTLLKAAFFLPPKLDAKQAKVLRSFETAFADETHGWITAFRKDAQPTL